MAVSLKSVPRVIYGVRLGLLLAGVLLLFVFDMALPALVCLVLSLAFGFALRFERVKVWLIARLTGIPADVVQAARGQGGGVARPTVVTKANLPADPWAGMGVTTPASPNPDAPRNFWHDPIPMSDEDIAAILDATSEPAVRLIRQWPPSDTFGNSWLGGTPNLPEDVEWPVNGETGLKLHHLGQIDLGEMPLPDATPIPSEGMLWFFADISQDLDWPEGPGQATRVLYHPASTKGRAPVELPDDVPEVDHSGKEMTGTPWSFRGPKIRAYPRWPVTGALTQACPFSDIPPEGVTDPNAYYKALSARLEAQKAALTGAKVELDVRKALARDVTSTQRTRADGSTFVAHERGGYNPACHGGRFPYHNRLGWHIANQGHHAALAEQHSYAGKIKRAEDRAEQPSDEDRRKYVAATDLLARYSDLRDRFAQADPTGPVAADVQAQFDALMQAANEPYAIARLENIATSGLIALVAEAVTAPVLLEAVPQAALECVHDRVLPSHHYTEHFVAGPKGAASNPTWGKGVRLAQFDSDSALGMMFCDCGIIDFWIAPEDLAAGRWDRAWGATAGG